MFKWKIFINYNIDHENEIDHEMKKMRTYHKNNIDYDISCGNDNKILDKTTTLSISNRWETLDAAVMYIKNYARQNGFEASIFSSRPVAKFLKCHYSGTKRDGRKDLDPSKHINKPSKKENCQWQININYSKFLGVHVTKFVDKHNHQIGDEDKFFHINKLIDAKLIEEIKIYVKESITPTQIKNILARKYQGIQLIDRKLDNVIQSIKKASKNDAADLYEKLNENKDKDPSWFVEVSVDIYTSRLNKLFWINPTQKKELE